MKECFVEKRFGADSLDIISFANMIIGIYAEQGYDLSLRQLFYQFISRDSPSGGAWFPNSEQSYKRLGDIISDARLAGLIDWNAISDRGRGVNANDHWEHPGEILDASAAQFRLDTWKDQPNYVMVMVEKDALSGVLEPVCRRLDMPFTANKGYASLSHLYRIGKDMGYKCDNYKDCHVLYLGDHDPSGLDMSRDVQERLSLFAGYRIILHRIALNMDQVTQYNPPPNPAKLTDSRADDYIAKYGRISWELDALDPATLAALVEDAVADLIDQDLMDDVKAKQKAYRAEIKDLAKAYYAKPVPDSAIGDDDVELEDLYGDDES